MLSPKFTSTSLSKDILLLLYKIYGGEGGIRTHESIFIPYTLSKRASSATPAPLPLLILLDFSINRVWICYNAREVILLDDLLEELQTGGLQKDLVTSGLAQIGSDLAMPCFTLAQQEGLSPQRVAEKIVATLKHRAVKKVEAVNGYVNLWLDSRFLIQRLRDLDFEQHPLSQQKPKKQKSNY